MPWKLCFLIAYVFLCSREALATYEYIRFEGSMYNWYGNGTEVDPDLALHSGQNFYLDFKIDTQRNPVGLTDDSYRDYFQISYVGGSLDLGVPVYGYTDSYPEGKYSWIDLSPSTYLGSILDPFNYSAAEDISTWNAGYKANLLMGNRTWEYSVGTATLTYRDVVPPDAYVPLPSAFYLFISALIFGSKLMTIKRAKIFSPIFS